MTVHLAALSKTNTLRMVFITCWARFKIPRAEGRLCPQPHLEPLPPEMPPKAPRSASVRVAGSTGALPRTRQLLLRALGRRAQWCCAWGPAATALGST